MNICRDDIFKKLFERCQPKVQRFLRSKGLDIEMSADIAQDAFVRLWNNCKKVTEDKALSYLFTVSNNLVIDSARRDKTKQKYLSELKVTHENMDPEYQLRMSDFKAKLEFTIESMATGSREVFLMSRFNDMSYKEIAAALGLSVKAVEKRMSIALKHLVENNIIRRK
ncbi:MAG: RNA polymerase sigma-70 factor (family 1) [Saprospiraceae bacterium]|jgi:RNA polymerase sigma-70 factor (family 1)|tara:strand:- start:1224 stop:1727 length:504 start_codon:yes stop_codon:yes gene_type:complete